MVFCERSLTNLGLGKLRLQKTVTVKTLLTHLTRTGFLGFVKAIDCPWSWLTPSIGPWAARCETQNQPQCDEHLQKSTNVKTGGEEPQFKDFNLVNEDHVTHKN